MFTITDEDIEKLSDEELRSLIGRLCELDARAECGSASGITYGGDQTAPDGGIDVRANLSKCSGSGFIPRSKTGFQCKAEKFPRAKIIKEMRPDGTLRQSILDLIEASGSYIIASTKGYVSDQMLIARKDAMLEAIADHPKAKQLLVDFYDRQRIATWVNQYPGAITWVRERTSFASAGWQPFNDWSSSPDELESEYVLDDSVKLVGVRLQDSNSLNINDGIEKLRSLLNIPRQSVRLVGLSGVGKTRLVQALFDDRIGKSALTKTEVVYADLSDAPSPTPQEMLQHLINIGERCILVIDNCGVDLHRKLAKSISKSDCLMSLITVEYDISDDEPEFTDTFKLEPSSKELIEKVVSRKFPDLSSPDVRTIAEFSDGNSRVALALAATAERGESLADLNDTQLVERLFQQKKANDPSLLRTAKALSLVYSFDGETLSEKSELALLASITGENVNLVFSHVSELHRRRLVQKRAIWRALLPHALAHKLAKQALEDFPTSFVKEALIDRAPERLTRSFSKRIGCLHDSNDAKKIVHEWLGKDDFLKLIAIGDKQSIVILENVAPVDPEACLEFLKKLFSSYSVTELDSSTRDSIASLLRALAFDVSMFNEASKMICTLAGESAKTNNTGDSQNVFSSLFYLYLSGTEAGPEQRVQLLRKLAKSDSVGSKERVLEALDAMLTSSHFSSFQSFEFGSRRRSFGYRPKTNVETWKWYETALDFSYELTQIERFQKPVREMLASRIGRLATLTNSPEKSFDLIRKIAAEGAWSGAWASIKRAIRQAQNNDQKALVKELLPMADYLAPNSLEEMIQTYVTTERWSLLDVAEVELEDETDKDGSKYERALQYVDEIATEIGSDLAQDDALMRNHLPAILKASNGRGWQVANGIAKSSDNVDSHWAMIRSVILSEEPEGNVGGFLGGFLQGLRERDSDKAERLMDDSLEDPIFNRHIVHMQFCLRAEGRGIARIIAAAKNLEVPVWTFANLKCGRFSDDVDESDLLALCELLCAREDGTEVATDIFDMRLFSKRSDLSLVTNGERKIGRFLLGQIDFGARKKNRQHHRDLDRIAKATLRSDEDSDLAKELLTKLRSGLQSYAVYGWDYADLVLVIAEKFPLMFLDVMVGQNDQSPNERREVFRGMRDRKPCPLSVIDGETLVDWANDEPESRFKKIASIIRPWQSKEKGNDPSEANQASQLEWTPDALVFLKAAPDPSVILDHFINSFEPSSWSGSRAQIIEARSSILTDLFEDENAELREQAKFHKNRLDGRLVEMKKREEESSRERDERFEW
jgi:hypothetical protein